MEKDRKDNNYKDSITSKLKDLASLIRKNNIEYSFTACVILVFVENNKKVLSHNEITNFVKEDLIKNKNKVFSNRGWSKQKINMNNLSVSVRSVINCKTYIIKEPSIQTETLFKLNEDYLEKNYDKLISNIKVLQKCHEIEPKKKIKKNSSISNENSLLNNKRQRDEQRKNCSENTINGECISKEEYEKYNKVIKPKIYSVQKIKENKQNKITDKSELEIVREKADLLVRILNTIKKNPKEIKENFKMNEEKITNNINSLNLEIEKIKKKIDSKKVELNILKSNKLLFSKNSNINNIVTLSNNFKESCDKYIDNLNTIKNYNEIIIKNDEEKNFFSNIYKKLYKNSLELRKEVIEKFELLLKEHSLADKLINTFIGNNNKLIKSLEEFNKKNIKYFNPDKLNNILENELEIITNEKNKNITTYFKNKK